MSTANKDTERAREFNRQPAWLDPEFSSAVRYVGLYGDDVDFDFADIVRLGLISQQSLDRYKYIYQGDVIENLTRHGKHSLRVVPPTPAEIRSLTGALVPRAIQSVGRNLDRTMSEPRAVTSAIDAVERLVRLATAPGAGGIINEGASEALQGLLRKRAEKAKGRTL